jgi:hypothetical protein
MAGMVETLYLVRFLLQMADWLAQAQEHPQAFHWRVLHLVLEEAAELERQI